MDRKEIEELEPKYTGNTRRLTEGEAYAIKNDPNDEGNEEDGQEGLLENIPAGLLIGMANNRTGTGSNV
jgi:hypothetical protein